MNFSIEKIAKKHLPMVGDFFCGERTELLNHYNAKIRRRILRRSKEMETFLREKALQDQEEGLSTTHLFIDEIEMKIVGFVSLCNDSIRLATDEKKETNLLYATIPALKIARLAVASDYQRSGIGKLLVRFVAVIAKRIKEMSGIVFITLDCYEYRISFYESMGFVKNMIQPVSIPYDSPISMRIGLEEYWKHVKSE